MSGLGKNDHIYLVDGSSYIFRAYHALPPLTRKSDGLPVGAISGFCNMLMKLRDDMEAAATPTHLAVIFDPPGGSFRNDIYDAYKANRGAPPEDLVPQFPLVRVATEAFGIPALEVAGFEADDLIASYTKAARAKGAQVTIVSSDKDLMQLIEDGVDMLDTMKDRRMGHDAVMEKFGVGPARVIDVQSLAGDSVDNVPGVPGIGVKTAAQLINEYGDLDSLLQRAAEIKQPKRRESLIEFADQARISRELVTLKCDTPLPADWDVMRLGTPEPEKLIGFLKAMEFTTLTKRVASRYAIDADQFNPADSLQAPAGQRPPETDAVQAAAPSGAIHDRRHDWPPIAPETYVTITHADDLAVWIARAEEQGFFAIDTETDGLDAMQCNLVGISLATAPGEAAYIPLSHGSGSLNLDGGVQQMPLQAAIDLLGPLCARDDIVKILQNAKFDLLVLSRYGVRFRAIEDTMLMSYAMAAGQHGHGMDELARLWLDHEAISIKTLLGTGKAQKTFDQVPIEEATRYAAEDADITLRLWMTLKPHLAQQGVTSVYETSERPLVPVIVDMEANGVMVDRQHLSHLSGELAQKMAAMESEIYALAETEFNIASPKQLGEVLFEKQALPGGKKTKTGAYATGADILEGLAAEGHALPAAVLRWRGMAKLKSTYTDALPEFINPTTGRIHTSYSLAATTTGRLSSSDPNLQNIPIRSEEGRRIRAAFIAPDAHVLVSADYSQIELRILAHMADIGALKTAFAEGQDIHAMTASEIFNVPMRDMTPEIRRRAKAINFGIILSASLALKIIWRPPKKRRMRKAM
jgi:DNA polymerase-1